MIRPPLKVGHMSFVFYSFRRCPYAMRARLALHVSGVPVRLREVVLRDKPDAFLAASPSATVPCLVEGGNVIDESLDIMMWALKQNDPEDWLDMPQEGWDWIEQCDGPFKHALDRTKYATRYPTECPHKHRADAMVFLSDLNGIMSNWIFERPTVADFAILPFVRQFAFIDKVAFDVADLPKLQNWLARFLESPRFTEIMSKYSKWVEGDIEPIFPSVGQ